MGVVVAVGGAQFGQTRRQHREMARFVIRHRYPVRVVVRRQTAEPVHSIPGQVDRVEFDVGDGVQESGPALDRAQPALRHIARMHEPRSIRAAGRCDGQGRWRVAGNGQPAGAEGRGGGVRQPQLLRWLCGIQALLGGFEK